MAKIGLKIFMTVIFLGLFIWFMIPVGAGIINAGNAGGAAISFILMVISLFRERFASLLSKLMEHVAGRAFVYAAGGLTGICVVLAVVISCLMIGAMNDSPKDRPTTLVVLGCQIRNERPSRMLARRLETAYGFLAEHEDVCAVVSGGQGSDEITSEAEVMKKYLVDKGISPDRIFMEDKSANTQENIRFSKELIEQNGLCGDITIVTDGFHQLRADMFAKREGLNAYNIPAQTPIWLLPTYWVREWFGISYYTIFG